MSENIESQAADLILGKEVEGEKFSIKFLGITLKFQIRPLTTRQLIRVSKYLSQITEIDQDKEMFPEMIKRSGELKHVCKAIAIATGSKIPFLNKIIEKQADIEDLFALINIIRKQSNPERFFFILMLARGMNQLKKKEE